MIDAYLDESGNHDGAGVCLIGGYFGGKGQMKKLERAWMKVLADYNIPLDRFHAIDMVKSKKYEPMLFDLAKAISEQRKGYPIAWGIVVNDFFSFSLPQRRFMTGAKLLAGTKGTGTSVPF